MTDRLPKPPSGPRKSPGRVYLLSKKIDAYLNERNSQGRLPRSWHASKLGNVCVRQLWYARTGAEAEKVIDPQYSRDGDAGTVLHEVYQQYFGALGIVTATEVPLPAGIIGGRLDVEVHGPIPRFLQSGESGLIEIKTMKTEHWSAMPDHYKFESYFAQIQIYLAARPDLQRALLFCVNRDDSRIKEFIVERNAEWSTYFQQRAAYLQQCYESSSLPDPEPSPLCNYCPYQVRCETDDFQSNEGNQ